LTNFENVVDYSVELYYVIIKLNYIVELNKGEDMKHKLLPLSETMHYILLAMREPLHGYAVMQKIEKISKGTVILAAGTLYGAIENLNKHGWIEPVGELGRRKVYMITAEGSAILKMEQNRLLHILSLYERSESNEEI
jgi:DNA-binding PadR family transcriptional regulator